MASPVALLRAEVFMFDQVGSVAWFIFFRICDAFLRRLNVGAKFHTLTYRYLPHGFLKEIAQKCEPKFLELVATRFPDVHLVGSFESFVNATNWNLFVEWCKNNSHLEDEPTTNTSATSSTTSNDSSDLSQDSTAFAANMKQLLQQQKLFIAAMNSVTTLLEDIKQELKKKQWIRFFFSFFPCLFWFKKNVFDSDFTNRTKMGGKNRAKLRLIFINFGPKTDVKWARKRREMGPKQTKSTPILGLF